MPTGQFPLLFGLVVTAFLLLEAIILFVAVRNLRREHGCLISLILLIFSIVGGALFILIMVFQMPVVEDKFIFEGVQTAIDSQCGEGYAQADDGHWFYRDAYYWMANRDDNDAFCEIAPGDTNWVCTCPTPASQ